MARWTIDAPTRLDFDGVVTLKANVVTGHVSILPSDDRPSLEVTDIAGHPLTVTHEAGVLTVSHETGGLDGVLKWLQTATRGRAVLTVTVPRDCPVQLNLGSADAVVTGLASKVAVKTMSGDVTLDGVTGTIEANTASGAIEAQGLDGKVRFNSLSGDLTLVGGRIERLLAHTVSGSVTADVEVVEDGSAEVDTVSGDVKVRLPESTSASVSLTSVTGRVDAAFVGLRRQDRTIGKSVLGTVGEGKATVHVNTVSGAITLLSRPHAPAVEGEQR